MAVAAAATSRPHESRSVVYDLLLLHGIPVEVAQPLQAGVGEGDSVFVSGEEWTVAAVRQGEHRTQLVCVRGL